MSIASTRAALERLKQAQKEKDIRISALPKTAQVLLPWLSKIKRITGTSIKTALIILVGGILTVIVITIGVFKKTLKNK